jgi:quercetin dioxygenase-like cupin family protein
MGWPRLHTIGYVGQDEGIKTEIFPRQWDFEVGQSTKGHTHGAPHATLVVSGRFLFRDERDGYERQVGPLEWIAVAAEDLHSFTCLEKGTIFCIFAGPGAEFP